MTSDCVLTEFEKVVTCENIGCIPKSWQPDNPLHNPMFNYHYINMCRRNNWGFLELAVLCHYRTVVPWLLKNFGSHIDLDSLQIQGISLLSWCSSFFEDIIPVLVKAGARKDVHVMFDSIADKCIINSDSYRQYKDELEHLLAIGFGNYGWTRGPRWLNNLVQTYRWRRNRCKSIVIKLLALVRFRRAEVFPRLDRHLLNQLLVGAVWASRYAEQWDFTSSQRLV